MNHRINRHFFRLAGIICAAACVFFSAAPLYAAAEEKSYQTDAAMFDISFSESGTATVTEFWSVTYTSGSFTRFYKDFFNPGNQLEYMPDINVISCHINGVEAVATNSMDRIDNHYFFEHSSSQKYTIHWFKAAQNETVQYDITYEIPNAVKLDENNQAEYCYRLIGANFPKTVGEVNTRIHLPDSNALKKANFSSGGYDTDGNTLYSSAQNVKGVFKVRLYMDPQYFGALQRIAAVDVPVNFSEKEVSSDSSSRRVSTSGSPKAFLAVFGFFAACPLIGLFSG